MLLVLRERSMNAVTYYGVNNTIDGVWNFSGIKQTFVVSRKRLMKLRTLVVFREWSIHTVTC